MRAKIGKAVKLLRDGDKASVEQALALLQNTVFLSTCLVRTSAQARVLLALLERSDQLSVSCAEHWGVNANRLALVGIISMRVCGHRQDAEELASLAKIKHGPCYAGMRNPASVVIFDTVWWHPIFHGYRSSFPLA